MVIEKSALEVVGLLEKGAVSPLELLDALAERIVLVEPAVNALPTLCFDRARDRARRLMDKPAAERGLLAGLPVPIKDLVPVAGVRTTYGSPIYAEYVPEESESIVTRLEERGGVVYAKSNTPEFGAGGHTFNEVFGTTANPWNTGRSAGGSSGGAAAALASGTAWIAHGSDHGGSLRIPASFCGVVGLRPSPGRVPSGPDSYPYGLVTVEGPMARNITDAALALDAMTGRDGTVPYATADSGGAFLAAALNPRKPGRIAFSPDLGITVVDPAVDAVLRRVADRLSNAGFEIVEAGPDLSGVDRVFHTLRGVSFAVSNAPLLEAHRDKLKPEVIWNIEKGLKLTGEQVIRAQREQVRLFHGACDFMKQHDLLLCPSTIVPPFPATERYVEECNGVIFDSYVDWMAITWGLTMVSLPILSIPCGVTPAGLPLGLQIAGRPGGEADLIAMARTIEDAIGDWRPATLPELVVR